MMVFPAGGFAVDLAAGAFEVAQPQSKAAAQRIPMTIRMDAVKTPAGKSSSRAASLPGSVI